MFARQLSFTNQLVSLCTGSFEPHFLCVPELGIKLPLQSGSIFALPSAYCDHFVSAFQGEDRFSLVLSCARSNVRQLNLYPTGEIEI